MSGVENLRWTSCLVPDFGDPGQAFSTSSDNVISLGQKVGKHLQRCHVYGDYGGPNTFTVCDPIDLEHQRIPEPNSIWVLVSAQGIEYVAQLRWEVHEQDQAFTRYKASYRLPNSLLLIQAYQDRWADSPVSELRLRVVASNPSVPESTIDIYELSVSADAFLYPRWRKWRDIPGGFPEQTLIIDDTIADGQAQTYVFDCVDQNIEPSQMSGVFGVAHGPSYSMYADYQYTRNWGPFKQTPLFYGNQQQRTQATLEEHGRWVDTLFRPGNRWATPSKGLALRPGQTGDQHDFGVSKLSEVLTIDLGVINLDQAYANALQESCRPNHYFWEDGNPIRWPVQGLVFWGDMKHWHQGVSPERLGKPLPTMEDTKGWWGRDWEHSSTNHLMGTYALTGCPFLEDEIRNFAEAYLHGCTTQPGWATTDRGAARSVGRRSYSLAWADWLFDLNAVRVRVMDRLVSSYGDLLANLAEDSEVRQESRFFPMYIHGKDGRKLNGKYPFWMPWQEAIAIQGLYALYLQVKDERILKLTVAMCENLIQYGWWQRSDGSWTVGDAVAYLGNEPLPAEHYGNEEFTKDHSGTDFDLWAWPAVAISYLLLVDSEENGERIQKILDHCRMRRAEQFNASPGFDRAGEWEIRV